MSYDALKWAYSQNLGHPAKAVLVALAYHADDDSWECWPSQDTLASMTGLHRSSVVRQVQMLARLRLLSKAHRQSRGGQRTSDSYRLNRAANVAEANVAGANVGESDIGPTLDVSPQVGNHVAQTNVGETNVAHSTNQRRPVRQEHLEEHLGGVELPLPSTPPSKSPGRTKLTGDTRFDEFWAAYPRKEGKGDAKKAWDAALKKVSAERLLDGARRYAKHPNVRREGGKYIKTPARWLNAECWDDDVPSETAPSEQTSWTPWDAYSPEVAR